MPSDGNEPQSYGSGEDWVTGDTGEEVNPQKSRPAPEHQEFYQSRHDSDGSAPHQGGHTSDVQLADCAQGGCDHPESEHADQPSVTKVTSKEGGAKQDSFFRKRDYS